MRELEPCLPRLSPEGRLSVLFPPWGKWIGASGAETMGAPEENRLSRQAEAPIPRVAGTSPKGGREKSAPAS